MNFDVYETIIDWTYEDYIKVHPVVGTLIIEMIFKDICLVVIKEILLWNLSIGWISMLEVFNLIDIIIL